MELNVENLRLSFSGSGFQLELEKLQCEPGEMLVICGESGCGKSTLLNLFSGIIPVDSGRIEYRLNNKSFLQQALSPAALRSFRMEHIGLVYQNFELIPYLSLLDNILLKNRLGSGFAPVGAVKESALRLADEAGLSTRLHQPAELLSQGEKQRTALCRALLNRPAALFADEPTANLDPHSSDLILNMIDTYQKQSNALVLMVTHSQKLIASAARRLAWDGRAFVEQSGGIL